MAEELSEEDLSKALDQLEIWGVEFERLATSIEFESYKEAVFFANTVFGIAEEHSHHPKVTVEYGRVNIDLWSHEEDAITRKDIQVAREIEERLSEMDWR